MDNNTHSFTELQALIHSDSEYAWAWQCNLAMPLMDATGVSQAKANEAAALIRRQVFNYDSTHHERYHWAKSGAQAYFEARTAA